MIDFDCIRFDPNGHPEDLIHNKDIGIAQHGETTEGDEKLNKATTQCPKVVEYVHVHVQV